MAIWSSIRSWFGWGASKRVPGEQITAPGSGRLTNRTVDSDTAMQISACFACVRLLSETIAGLPLHFYELKPDGSRVLRTDHPLSQLLNTRPNRYQTRVEFFETLVSQKALHGNAYHRIDRNRFGDVVSLMPYMTPQVKTYLLETGNIEHLYYDGRKDVKLSQDQMWHNKLFGNGIVGMSVLDYARNSIGVAISAEDRVNKIANNGFKQTGVLSLDKILSPDQRKAIRQNFSDLTEGAEDALFVLEAGAKYSPTSMNPKDVQFLESRRFQIEDICRFFGVPSVLVNDTAATTVWGSGIQQIITGFYKLGLRPYLERIEASITNWLLKPDERYKIIPEFDFDSLLRGDEKTRFETYRTAIQGGILVPNECRKKEGLAPVKGGDSLLVQQQMIPLERAGEHIKTGGNNEPKKAPTDTAS